VPGVDSDIVRNAFTHDPEQYDFKAGDLPSLYLFPEKGGPAKEQVTADLQVTERRLRLFWLLPPAAQFKQSGRARAISRVAELVGAALRRGQDPCFVIDGDTDPTAARYGSVVIRHAGLSALEAGAFTCNGRIAIRPPGNAKRDDFNVGLYDGLQMEIVTRSMFVETPNVPGPDGLGPYFTYAPARVKATITPNDSEDAAVEYRDPKTDF
jgi:hypothetical protein